MDPFEKKTLNQSMEWEEVNCSRWERIKNKDLSVFESEFKDLEKTNVKKFKNKIIILFDPLEK